MAEYIIQSETLESMADKIRILNGVEGTLTTAQMDGNLGEANADVSTQADLIAQISSALEGKGAGGGISGDTYTVLNNLPCDVLIGLTRISSGTSVKFPYTNSSTNMSLIVLNPNITLNASISSGGTILCFCDADSKWVLNTSGTIMGMPNLTVWFIMTQLASGDVLELSELS